ncbi:uncharacterized protein SEPMUDRAFT_147409 [Sphaerulina musiva SO2202]|uniref:Zn(2)-C6 fungal-type domain-containing protein n=1 Tax=Sphaerulina musiva (strain SO2202) TaxID=692275 RepID=M3DBX5_SPHMS|nr:uncharacterized protein SEPMUDRAFT_147409 [Sphaerulina musiva SO2202]EMF15565.1 hypothetical protein SEPMUDRAFT_147409 [Sphaerulina musiva SO2202]
MEDNKNTHPPPKTRRAQVANACMKCRDAKLKCSSTRPVCDRCLDRKLACVYDVTEGMTKRQQDRVDLLDSGEQLHRRRMLLQFLQRARIEEAVEMLARLRSGYSLDSEYLRVQDRFRLQDGVFVLLEEEKQQQQQQQQGSSQRRTSTTTTSRTVPDAPTQEAIQREYLELIKWSNMPIDPQLLGEKGQQQQQQQRKDQQERQQEERHEQPEQQQQPE